MSAKQDKREQESRPGEVVSVARSWKPGAAGMVWARWGRCRERLSATGTSAASTSGGATSMSSTTSHRPRATACTGYVLDLINYYYLIIMYNYYMLCSMN